MTIRSVRASVADPSALGRPPSPRAGWHADIDHMNPLGRRAGFVGQADRFAPRRAEAICVVEATDGSFGIGMTDLAGVVVPLINEFLGPMLVGSDPEPVEDLWDMMSTAVAAHIGSGGVSARAISAVDLALWDLRGRRAGLPVHELITPGPKQELSCYATGLDAERFVAAGFEAIKLPCPWGPDRDESITRVAELLAEAREVGGEVELMLDGWAIMDRNDAIAVAKTIEPLGLRWLEDALHPDDIDGWAVVGSEAPNLPRATGERWHTIGSFERAARIGAIDVLQPDALWVGGATPTIRIAEIARAHGCEVSVHCGANDAYGQHLAAALQPDGLAELYVESSEPSTWHHYRSTPGMAVPEGGRLTVSDAAGFGIDLSPDDVLSASV